MDGLYFEANATDVVKAAPARSLLESNVSYYVALAALLLAASFLRPRKHNAVDAPLFKAPRMKWMFSADTLVKDSYNKFRDRVYQIRATEGLRTLIPAFLIGELKGLPEETLSATEAVNEAMLCEYTRFSLGPHNETLLLLIRNNLTQRLARLVPRLRGELQILAGQEFPECQDWTPIKIHPFMVRSIARLSGCSFVGQELGRSEAWMDASANFAIHVFVAVVKLQFFPPWMRPVAQYLVSELRQIRRDLDRGAEMLKPIIDQRLRDDELNPSREKEDDFVQWLLDALPEIQKQDYAVQAQIQLVLGAASIHNTCNLITDCFYDLAVHKDLQEVLREEAHTVLETEDGWARKDSMAKLKKLDSFIKESQRFGGNITSFIRKVLKPIDLSDGTHLPAGTNLLAPQCGISQDERYFPDPGEFDGLRFWKMRQRSDEAANRYQFTSIGDTTMHFGLGKHACPGRFFAGNEIKVILSHFLLNYDIRLKDGESRPEPSMFMMIKAPSQTAEILFRRRS